MDTNLYNNKKKYGFLIFISFICCFTQRAESVVNFTGTLAGNVTGKQKSTVVATVGGITAANVASGANLANAATTANTANTLVKRGASGNFIAGTITATLNGSATTAGNFSGSLAGDVTGVQSATVVSKVGGVVASNVASGVNAANAATNVNTVSTIVKRDGSGNFSTNAITLNELDLLSTDTLFVDGNLALGENATLFVDLIAGASGTLANSLSVINLNYVNNNSLSDRRVKTDISDLDSELCLALINQLVPHEYTYVPKVKKALGEDDQRHVGFIAQELAKIDPRFVKVAAGTTKLGDLTIKELAFVRQELLVPLLVGALKAEDKKLLVAATEAQKLQARVQALEEFIASMKKN